MNQLNLLEGILVAALFLGYVLLWRIKKMQQTSQTGINPEVIYSDSRPSQKLFAILSRLMTFLVIILILLHIVGIENTPGFYKISSLDHSVGNIVGFAIGVLGLIICFFAQKAMGDSWRVGIDETNRTDLITTGIYKKIRNPTYSGLFLLCMGVLIIFPTMSFLTWNLIFFIMLEFQVRNEEEFLIKQHQDAYTEYCSNTKRYFPYLY